MSSVAWRMSSGDSLVQTSAGPLARQRLLRLTLSFGGEELQFVVSASNQKNGFVNKLLWVLLFSPAGLPCYADDLGIGSFTRDGALVVTNTFTNGVVTLEKSSNVNGPWLPEANVYSFESSTQLNVTITGNSAFYRVVGVDLSDSVLGFSNLVQSYGLLSTVAGSGGRLCSPCNNWNSDFEGGLAVNAELSHPHIAMADRAGNIYIADKEAHAIRKVTPDGRIYTVAGINSAGTGTTEPALATTVALRNPNGLWVRDDGTFYILDTDNGYVRKVDTDGIITTLVTDGGSIPGGPIPGGRGLWVSPDESLIFFAAFSEVKSWDTTNGLSSFASGFTQLGNIAVDPNGLLVVTDRAANRVYRIESDGTKTLIAGNGTFANGGDGALAVETGLKEVRGIWFLPSGAYFLATDGGSQVWYVDTAGYIHLFLNGGDTYSDHAGDGAWFYDDPASLKVSKVREITMDFQGNLLITENDAGYVRKVQFLRHLP
jgi:hypothetical protein